VNRPPGTDVNCFNVEIDKLLYAIGTKYHFFLAGDFNLNLLNVEEHEPTNDFFYMLMSHNMLPTITRPTRVTEFSAALINNVFTNITTSYEFESYIIYDDTSDRFPVLLEVDLKCKHFNNVMSLERKRRTYNSKFVNNISSIGWSDITAACSTSVNTDSLFNNFLATFDGVFNKSYPIQLQPVRARKSGRENLPWLTLGLIKCCR